MVIAVLESGDGVIEVLSEAGDIHCIVCGKSREHHEHRDSPEGE